MTCRTRAPCRGSASARIRSTTSGADDARVVVEVLLEEGHAFEQRTLPRLVRRRKGRRIDRRVNLSTDAHRAVVCPDKFRGTLAAARGRGRDGRGAAPRRLRRRSSSCRSPTAVRARSTRCSPRAAGRAARARVTGPLGDPVDAEWACCPAASRSSRWRARAGSRSSTGRNDPLRASTRGTGELIAAALAQRRAPGDRRRRRQRDDRRRARRGRGARLVVRTGSTVTVACDVDDAVPRRRARLRPAEGRDATRRSRCSPAGSQQLADAVPRRAPASTSRRSTGARRGRRARRRPRRDRRASSSPASTSSPTRSGSRTRSTASTLVVTGEGKLDATSFDGQGRGRRARVGGRRRRRRTSR